MPWAGNIAKAMTSDGKQFTVTRSTVHCWPLLHVMVGISARFSNFAFVLFCYITNHLMTGPLGNSEFCFPRISMFPDHSWSRITADPESNVFSKTPRTNQLHLPKDPQSARFLRPNISIRKPIHPPQHTSGRTNSIRERKHFDFKLRVGLLGELSERSHWTIILFLDSFVPFRVYRFTGRV